MIVLNNVTKTYQTYRGKFQAVNNVTLSIPDGQCIAITGHSGSGKSTLLNLMSGIDFPTFGNITILGKNLGRMLPKEIADFRSHNIGFIFQSFYLEPEYTVYQNVEIPLIIAGYNQEERESKIKSALTKVNLLHKINQKTRFLSGGEQQKCCVARAIVNDPKIIFADEPCGKLDSENGEIIMDLLVNLKNEGRTIIIVTHNMEDAKKTDRKIVMKDGSILEDIIQNA